MSDLPPDLPRLRTLETWLAMSLDRVRQQIATVEQQERAQQPGKGRLAERPREQEKRPVEERRPRFPDWGITEVGIGSPAAEVHRGDCWAAGKTLRAVSREGAAAALADGVRPCEVCQPEVVLGTP